MKYAIVPKAYQYDDSHYSCRGGHCDDTYELPIKLFNSKEEAAKHLDEHNLNYYCNKIGSMLVYVDDWQYYYSRDKLETIDEKNIIDIIHKYPDLSFCVIAEIPE